MSLVRRALKKGSAEFIPYVGTLDDARLVSQYRFLTVIIDEVGHCDAEECTLHSSIKPRNALAINNTLRCGERSRSSLLSLDLRSG